MALIETIHGPQDDSALIKTEGQINNDNEYTRWVEYRETPDGEIVHRSVHVHLKTGLLLESGIGGF